MSQVPNVDAIKDAWRLKVEGKTQEEIAEAIRFSVRQVGNYLSIRWLQKRGLEYIAMQARTSPATETELERIALEYRTETARLEETNRATAIELKKTFKEFRTETARLEETNRATAIGFEKSNCASRPSTSSSTNTPFERRRQSSASCAHASTS